MAGPRYDPSQIGSPLALLAALLIAGFFLIALLLKAAAEISEPSWAAGALVVASIVLALLLPCGIYRLLTRFRPETLGDDAYLKWRDRQFRDFEPDVVQPDHGASGLGQPESHSGSQLEQLRVRHYQDNRGLFLGHLWRPSTVSRQVADIEIFIQQHGDGPLSAGSVSFVDYQLGPKFSRDPIRKSDPSDGFRLDVSAYGPMLCLARVQLKETHVPILLYRYIDFPVPNQL